MSSSLLLGFVCLAAVPSFEPNVAARGASNARVRVEPRGEGMKLTVQALVPGEYEILVGPRCPMPKLPAENRTGRVPSERNGSSPKPLGFEARELGRIVVTDKTVATETSLRPLERSGSNFIMLREAVSSSPSLSDPFGLVACGRLPSEARPD